MFGFFKKENAVYEVTSPILYQFLGDMQTVYAQHGISEYNDLELFFYACWSCSQRFGSMWGHDPKTFEIYNTILGRISGDIYRGNACNARSAGSKAQFTDFFYRTLSSRFDLYRKALNKDIAMPDQGPLSMLSNTVAALNDAALADERQRSVVTQSLGIRTALTQLWDRADAGYGRLSM